MILTEGAGAEGLGRGRVIQRQRRWRWEAVMISYGLVMIWYFCSSMVTVPYGSRMPAVHSSVRHHGCSMVADAAMFLWRDDDDDDDG